MPVLGVDLTICQPDPEADQMSSWPDVVPLFSTRCLYCGVHLTWVCPTVNVKLTLCLTVNVKLALCLTASWFINMSSNSGNVKLPFLASTGGWGVGSANMSSNSRNLKSPFLATGYLYWGRQISHLICHMVCLESEGRNLSVWISNQHLKCEMWN